MCQRLAADLAYWYPANSSVFWTCSTLQSCKLLTTRSDTERALTLQCAAGHWQHYNESISEPEIGQKVTYGEPATVGVSVAVTA